MFVRLGGGAGHRVQLETLDNFNQLIQVKVGGGGGRIGGPRRHCRRRLRRHGDGDAAAARHRDGDGPRPARVGERGGVEVVEVLVVGGRSGEEEGVLAQTRFIHLNRFQFNFGHCKFFFYNYFLE